MSAALAAFRQKESTRRAWLTVAVGVTLFVTLAAAVAVAATWTVEHATVRRTASARVISGSGALWRASSESEWSLFDGAITLDEGDELSTELGTVIWITMFDGSTLEVTERSHVRFDRLRESRFSDEARQIRIELVQGTIFGAMAPVVDFAYGELEIVAAEANIVVKGDRDTSSNPSPSFVIEARGGALDRHFPFRTAAFRGQVEVHADAGDETLVGPEQVEIDDTGALEISQTIHSEVIANGSFADGLDGWDPTYSAEAREPQERAGSVMAVQADESVAQTALRIRRDDSGIWAKTGVSQTIDRTLRLPAALTLTFDVLITHQGAPAAGRQTVPLAIELDYTDILGQDRTWTTVYSARRDEGLVDADAFTIVNPDEWTKVIVELENLEPIPKILGTLVVYASGGGYASQVANLSLTTGEGTAIP